MVYIRQKQLEKLREYKYSGILIAPLPMRVEQSC